MAMRTAPPRRDAVSLAIQAARQDAALVPGEALRAVERLAGRVRALDLEVERADARAARLLDHCPQRCAAHPAPARRLLHEELVDECIAAAPLEAPAVAER